MGRNTIKGVNGTGKNPALSVREAPSPTGRGAGLTRRRLVKGAAAAAPVILTLRSGAALAQVSAYATAWQPGLTPSAEPYDVHGICAGPAQPAQEGRFTAEVVESSQWPDPPTDGKCPTDWNGFDLVIPADKIDTCCPPGTVLVTASSATSLYNLSSTA